MTMFAACAREAARQLTDGPLLAALAPSLDERAVGGKAAALGRLIGEGHDVPAGFVITDAAFQRFLSEADLAPIVDGLCAKLDVRSVAGVHATADTIAALVREASLPTALDELLDGAADALGPGLLIVRSSAVGEDSRDASFAGQLDSIADVRGRWFLRQAIRDVWASRWSARALAYQLARGVRLAGMGVIIQRQVPAQTSGVLFTLDPSSPDRMLVEYCAGPGGQLVSGGVTPGRLTFDRSHRHRSGRPAARSSMSAYAADALADAGFRIERTFGSPQDIEWTIDGDGRLWILQSRPITTRPGAAAADPIHWSNANVSENFPAPVSPLLYSIARVGYYHYFKNLGRAFGLSRWRLRRMQRPLAGIIGVQAGRIYYNLSSIHGILRSAPFGDLLASSFNQFVGAADTPAEAVAGPFRSGRRLLAQSAELVVIAVKTIWQYAFITRRVARFERVVSEFAAATRPDALQGRALQPLVDDMRRFREIRNHRWNDAALADAASMVCYGVLQRLLAYALPSRHQGTLQNSLLRALPGLVSSMPAVELWRLSREVRSDARLRTLFESSSHLVLAEIESNASYGGFRESFRQYLDTWGFRCSGELMLTIPSFQERPEELLDLIRTYAALDTASPADQLQAQAEDRRRETAAIAAEILSRRRVRIPVLHLWTVVSIVLRATQGAILLRERARLKQALLYSRLRHIALTIGAWLVDAEHLEGSDDVFFLTADEIDDLASGTAMFPSRARELVALRRSAHETFTTMTPPDAMTLTRGEYWDPRSAARRSPPDPVQVATGSILTGVGACGGVTKARAAILADISEAARLAPGDVLVTRQTDPGWGPLFPLVSGLVIERGGMLSHGAIIAREFGIPSVVGVEGATAKIRHGASITVDGDRGLVRVHDEQEVERG